MKIGEEWIREGDKLIHKKTHDFTPAIHRAKILRDAGKQSMGESKLVGTIPLALINEWLKEAGIKWDDPARDDIIKRKILSGDFDKLRVWQGTY